MIFHAKKIELEKQEFSKFENSLLLVSVVLGGGLGIVIGLYLFSIKSLSKRFHIVAWVAMVIQVSLVTTLGGLI